MIVTTKVQLDIDPEAWRLEYGTSRADTADDIRKYVASYVEETVKDHFYRQLGLGRKAAQDEYLGTNSTDE